jgi:hypothetical protein
MPAFYKIDKERRLVLTTCWGVFSLADAVSHQQKLAKDPDFDPGFSQIADFTQVTQFDVTADDIHRFAQSSIFSPVSRRAILMANEAGFGVGRMYEILRGLEGEKGIRVFRTLDEALDWVFARGATA